MKKFFLMLIAFMVVASVQAAPALRIPMRVKQADGTWLTIQQFGDEYHHWTATSDGTMVINTGHGFFVADIDEAGMLKATNVLAHESTLRSSEEQALIQKQAARRTLFHHRGQQARNRAVSIGENRKYLPHMGDVRVLAILAEYQDSTFIVNQPVVAFDQILNGDTQEDLGNANTLNIGSVRQYFEACSNGQFSPTFDVVGPVTLPQNMAYYGGESNNGSDDNFSQFCIDVMAKVKENDLVADWSLYDNDNDNFVELVCIIFAGYGQNQGGGANTLWAKASNQNLKIDDTSYTVSFFNCSPELFNPSKGTYADGTPYDYSQYINGIGVFNHEMSHCMGLPDLYATQSSAYVNNQGMESWDVMDYGLYNRNGFAPAIFTAWEQETMGWTEIQALSDNTSISDMKPLEQGGAAYKICNSDNEREYIVMENIQKSGKNSFAANHGLLVYHVAYPYTNVNMIDHPNNNPGRPAVAVVPAGGMLINRYLRGEGKPYTNNEWSNSVVNSVFPGNTTNPVTSLKDEMALPNYLFYVGDEDSKEIGCELNNIKEENGVISFDFSKAVPTAIQTISTVTGSDADVECYDLQGRRIVRPTQKGLYIRNGRKIAF